MVKRVAQRLQLEGETGELNVAREAEKATIMRELARLERGRGGARATTRGVTTQRRRSSSSRLLRSRRRANAAQPPPPSQQPPQPAISDPSLPRMPHPASTARRRQGRREHSEYSPYLEYDQQAAGVRGTAPRLRGSVTRARREGRRQGAWRWLSTRGSADVAYSSSLL